ncbi:unnamed protein product [Cylindrotheca closterium]|uniref:Protein ENHANCED DISEASE RESISTANCE 2 C-terminal domain-containing protein n=1 Tax=Cylindrotheca closterium TaxID=2856 RepID=A0AAD2FKF8_9STRA|nr:unnamed protein product [Cylindrotheca closterium]
MERRSVYRRSSAHGTSPSVMRSRSAERTVVQDDEEALTVEVENLVCEDAWESPMSGGSNRDLLSESTRSASARKLHRRAMSDPFDTADSQGFLEENAQEVDEEEEDEHVLATLPRFPYAETNNKNCWSETPVKIFSVRGESYLKTKKKVNATEYLLHARGCDLFVSHNPSKVELSHIHGALGGTFRHVPSLLIRLTFPWGMLLQYYEVSANMLPFMRGDQSAPTDHLTKQEKTLAQWLLGDDNYKSARLKLIPNVVEGPWIVRNLVAGTPTIIGKKVPMSYQYVPKDGSLQDFFECNLDVGNSTKAAQKIVSVCRRYMTALTVDIGFVIEGTAADELPEQMMGAIRIHQVDSDKAPTVQ